MSTDPTAAVSAAAAPEIPAKNMEDTIDTWARPPVIEPTKLFAKSINRRLMPPASMSSPAKMKKGIAVSGNESMEVNIFWAITISETDWMERR